MAIVSTNYFGLRESVLQAESDSECTRNSESGPLCNQLVKYRTGIRIGEKDKNSTKSTKKSIESTIAIKSYIEQLQSSEEARSSESWVERNVTTKMMPRGPLFHGMGRYCFHFIFPQKKNKDSIKKKED
ncbi:hypothetical protein YC2023_084189 [Brassica napus]